MADNETLDFETDSAELVAQQKAEAPTELVEKKPTVEEMIQHAASMIRADQIMEFWNPNGNVAYFTKAACNTIMKYTGASREILKDEFSTKDVFDSNGKPHTIIYADARVRVSWPDGTFQEDTGGADTTMKFYTSNGKGKPAKEAHEVRRSFLMAHAVTAATNRCIRSRASLDGIPITLIPATFKKLKGVKFKSGR